MTESGKRRIHRNRAQDKRQHQSRKSDQIVSHPPPEQKPEDAQQQTKKNEMFGAERHGRHASGVSLATSARAGSRRRAGSLRRSASRYQ